MDTATSIIVSQVPLGIACFLGAYELHKIRKEMEGIKKHISERR
jgi:hypothetical protein